jgi:hypothetical protein
MFRAAPQRGTSLSLSSVASHLTLQSLATLGCDRPMTYCMPHGVPDEMTVAELPFKTLHIPGVTVLLFEEFHNYRQIHTDGRQLPVDPNPAWKRSVVLSASVCGWPLLSSQLPSSWPAVSTRRRCLPTRPIV